MTRNDWVFVGIRLYGMFLTVSSLQASLSLLNMSRRQTVPGAFWEVANVGVPLVLGIVLLVRAPAVTNWLQRKDRAHGPELSGS
ncbi:MAG TPA: hypothetical protein VM509_09525 [Planctomycetota bacterium]|nr:hypothetical protein [Planctomycetota bacterium]